MRNPLIDRHILESFLRHDLANVQVEPDSRMGFQSFIHSFSVERQMVELNRKRDSGNISDEMKENSLSNYMQINTSFRRFLIPENEVTQYARQYIAGILPPLALIEDEMWPLCGYGPGTVFHAKLPRDRSLQYKIGGMQTVSYNCLHLAHRVLRDYFPNWKRSQTSSLKVLHGNRVAFVAKDEVKCRQIAVEPSLNVFIQKGIGEYLIRLLKRRGVADLFHGQERHRRLVREYGTIGTIDLSNASDSISVALARSILPADWYELLMCARSPNFLVKGVWNKSHILSSQGNAFTFPIETLIFKALAAGVNFIHHNGRDSEISVYGDDIIAPKRVCESIARVFPTYGFSVNVEKSFYGQHGCVLRFFRESCGNDTLFGVDVRPVYYKQDAHHPMDVMALHNRLYERWGFLPSTLKYLRGCVEPRDNIVGPRYYISSDSDDASRNVESCDYSSWFWHHPDEPLRFDRWNPELHDYSRKQLYFTSRVRPLRKRDILDHNARLSAFLLGGSVVVDSSPLGSKRIRSRMLLKGATRTLG